MKKILMILVAIVGFGLSGYAQTATCKVEGDTENSTVVATIISYDHKTGEVSIMCDNDSAKVVNVQVTVKWNSKTKTVNVIVQPRSSSDERKLMFSADMDRNYVPSITINGAKCQK
jgi:P pilus assembly chaperone PapD